MSDEMIKNTPWKNSFFIGVFFSCLFVIFNFFLRLIRISANDIALDEPFAIWWAQQDIGAIFNLLRGGNDTIIHYLILHFWIKLFGIGALSVRMPSVIFSSLSAGLIFYTGYRFFSHRVAWAAGIIFTFSVMQMYFSHEARVYPLFVLLALWNLYLMLAVIKKPDKRQLFIWVTINNILLVYSHYFGWIPVLIQLFIFLVFSWRRKLWKPAFLSMGILLLCYIPNFLVLIDRFLISSAGTWVRKPEWSELYGNINRFLNSRFVTLAIILSALIGFIIVAVKRKLKLLFTRAKQETSFQMVLLWFCIPYMGMFGISYLMPVFLDRYLLFTTPALYLVIAALFELFPVRKSVKILIMFLPLVTILFFFDLSPSNNRNVKELVATVDQMKKNGSPVLISPDYAVLEFAYYFDNEAFCDYTNTYTRLKDEAIYPVRTIKQLPQWLIDTAKSVLYVDCGSEFAYGSDVVGNELNEYFIEKEHTQVPGIYTLKLFEK
jgi:mannosyltransferase